MINDHCWLNRVCLLCFSHRWTRPSSEEDLHQMGQQAPGEGEFLQSHESHFQMWSCSSYGTPGGSFTWAAGKRYLIGENQILFLHISFKSFGKLWYLSNRLCVSHAHTWPRFSSGGAASSLRLHMYLRCGGAAPQGSAGGRGGCRTPCWPAATGRITLIIHQPLNHLGWLYN